MSNTSKSIAVILILLLVAAVIVGVCYSQGVFDALIPGGDTPGTDTPGTDTPGTDTPGTDTPGTDTPGTDTPGGDTSGGNTDEPGTDEPGGNTDEPGTDEPGGDTPGGNTDEPGTDEPGTDEPEEGSSTVIVSSEDYEKTDGVYLLKPNAKFAFDIVNLSADGAEMHGSIILFPEPNDPYYQHINGQITVGTYSEIYENGELINTLWSEIKTIDLNEWTELGSYGAKMLKGVAIENGQLIVETGQALEELYTSQRVENWGNTTYFEHYNDSVTQCYIEIFFANDRYETLGSFKMLVTSEGQSPIDTDPSDEPEQPAEDPIVSLSATLDAPIENGIYQLDIHTTYEIALQGTTQSGKVVDIEIATVIDSAHGKIMVGDHQYTRDNGTITNEQWSNVHELNFSEIADRYKGGIVTSGNKIILTTTSCHTTYVKSVFTENWGLYRGTDEYYGEVEDLSSRPYIQLSLTSADGQSVTIKYIVV